MKRSTNNTIVTIIICAVAFIIAVIFIGIIINKTNQSRESMADSSSQLEEITGKYSSYAAYDGNVLSGKEVREVATAIAADSSITVTVIPKSGETDKVTTGFATADKINDKGSFLCKVSRDANGIVSAVTFTQQ